MATHEVRSASSWAAADLARIIGGLSATGPTSPLLSPFDGTLLAEVPSSTAGDVRAAADRARAAQPGWAATPVGQRMQVLLRFHDRLLDRCSDLADLLQRESGKLRLTAFEEVLHTALTARYYGTRAARYLRSERGEGIFPLLTRIDRHYRAKGLVGVIAPWNYPLTIAFSDGLAALVAGNAVLLKPDAQTPLIALAARELLEACGLPADLWQVVNGVGAEVGPELIDVSDYVCFTGSTATGRLVAARCAERLIGCSLELGGKNPLLVLDDADVTAAAEGAVRASFSNTGQLCVSSERIFVAEAVYDEFATAFVARTKALRLGNSLDFDADLAGMINATMVERVSAQVADARDKGATVLAGGERRPDLGDLFFEPTILADVTPEMEVYATETFGPVVSLYRVRDDAEAIARANDSSYGLNGSVWSGDVRRGRRVAEQISCGTVNVNEGFAASFGSIDAPMGGMKQSGLGRRQGKDGIRRFVEVQSVATQSGLPVGTTGRIGPRTYTTAMVGALRLLRRLGRA